MSCGGKERCDPCPAGRYCPAVTESVLCPAGSYCPLGSSAPAECAAGEFCPLGSAAPAPCPAGMMSAAGAAHCTKRRLLLDSLAAAASV